MIRLLLVFSIVCVSTLKLYKSSVFRPILPTWTAYERRPDDPTLSCYQLSNGTWFCASDIVMHATYDADDSY